MGEYQRALVEGREGVDPSRPETFVLSPDQLAARVFAAQDAEAARNGRRVLMEAGLVHDLRLPISEMGTPPPSREQRAEMETTRARYRTEHAGVVAKIRRALRGKVTA